MKSVKVDDARRVRLTELNPGDYYEAEIHGPRADEVTLRRLAPPKRVWTKKEALKAINKSPLCFAAGWDQVKQETR